MHQYGLYINHIGAYTGVIRKHDDNDGEVYRPIQYVLAIRRSIAMVHTVGPPTLSYSYCL